MNSVRVQKVKMSSEG